MTAVIGRPLAYMLQMEAESKNCVLSVITCPNHIIATQEATSVTLQISAKAGYLMKTSGKVVSHAKSLFSLYFLAHNLPCMQLLFSHKIIVLVGHDPASYVIYTKHILI